MLWGDCLEEYATPPSASFGIVAVYPAQFIISGCLLGRRASMMNLYNFHKVDRITRVFIMTDATRDGVLFRRGI
jgi:hypothetical protein